MIASSALFEDSEPNAFVEEFRPALWIEAIKTLPKSTFEYSIEALKLALLSLRSAYGPVRIFLDSFVGTIEHMSGKGGNSPPVRCKHAEECLRSQQEQIPLVVGPYCSIW